MADHQNADGGIDVDLLRILEAVAGAARAYRETMRRAIREQAAMLDAGVPLDEVPMRTASGFAHLAEAEDALDDALVVLAWYDASARSD